MCRACEEGDKIRVVRGLVDVVAVDDEIRV